MSHLENAKSRRSQKSNLYKYLVSFICVRFYILSFWPLLWPWMILRSNQCRLVQYSQGALTTLRLMARPAILTWDFLPTTSVITDFWSIIVLTQPKALFFEPFHGTCLIENVGTPWINILEWFGQKVILAKLHVPSISLSRNSATFPLCYCRLYELPQIFEGLRIPLITTNGNQTTYLE